MNSRALRRIAFLTAAVSTSALVLAGCASAAATRPAADSDEPITLTVTTFGSMGLDDLYAAVREGQPQHHDQGDQHRHRWQRADRLADQAGRRQRTARRAGRRRGLAQQGHAGERLVHRPDASTAPTTSRTAGSTGRSSRPPTPRAASSATAPTSAPRASATTASSSPLPACRPIATRSPRTSAATTPRGTSSSRSARPTTRRPARRGTTSPDSSGTRWSTSCPRATTPPTAS